VAPRGSLDTYRGNRSGDELTLSWGTGLQVLKRAEAAIRPR
jgi:hypothetical protein